MNRELQNPRRVLGKLIEHVEKQDPDDLIASLFSVMDTDTLPPKIGDSSLEAYLYELKNSIFVPAIGDQKHLAAMREAMAKGKAAWADDPAKQRAVEEIMVIEGRPEVENGGVGFDTGMYGTQRQTVMLVDWEGKVTFVERALWDSNGNAIPRGQGDHREEFQIEGWDD